MTLYQRAPWIMIGAKVAAGSFAPSFCSFKIAPACVFVVINSTAKIDAAAESVGLTTRGIGVAASALSRVAGRALLSAVAAITLPSPCVVSGFGYVVGRGVFA